MQRRLGESPKQTSSRNGGAADDDSSEGRAADDSECGTGTMIQQKMGSLSGLLLCVAASGAAVPPVEALRPQRPDATATPAVRPVVAADDEGTNSGGPGTPAREAGVPAPAAEPESAANNVRRFGIWTPKRTEERPIPLFPLILTEPKPLPPDIGETKPVEAQPTEPMPVVERPIAPAAGRAIDPFDQQVDEAIDVTARRVLIAETRNPNERPHTPWQIGHGMLAFRRNYVVRVNGEKVDAFEWVAKNPIYRAKVKRDGKTTTENLPWFYLTPYGARPQKFTGEPYEFEGHPNQFLSFFALARLPEDFEFTIQGRKVTFGQMLNNAKMEVNDREEVTWVLWTLAFYLDTTESWTNARREPWSMERLVQTTIHQFSPTRSPCGGCHALFALAAARNAHAQAGHRMTGVWTQAQMHLDKHIALAKAQQNGDGSFSSNYFKGPGYSNDPSKRISTSGHTLEFLMMALRQDQLHETWVRNGVAAVARDLIQYQREPLEVGGMYHAAHALVLYRERTRTELATGPKPVTPVAADGEKSKNE
jgi:hypothetical protein